MKLEGLRIVYLIHEGFEDLEFYVPLMRLREEGAEVIVAGPKANADFIGKTSLHAKSDVSFDSINPSEYDALIVPGGWAPDKLRRYNAVKAMTRWFYENNRIVAMICHAGLVGISAGIVRGHESTGSEGIKDDLLNAGATWRDEAAFRSGNIVWGRVVADIPAFCRELVAALEEYKSSR
ncbi:MAG: type 1 glutamine amidotransferase domain-containing protein [Chloroflexota bacterium]|jgi:protease I